MTMANTLLSIKGLEVVYIAPKGVVKALRDINLEIYEGETLSIVGESGSGKTTLLLSIMRLLPPNSRIIKGSIALKAENGWIDLTGLDENSMRRVRWSKVALVSQAAMNAFNPVLRIKDHFIETARAHMDKFDRELILREARELLKLVMLEPERVLNSYPHQLSGGMKQRTLIALSLLLKPKLILMDEPTSALDVVSQKIILGVLRDLKGKIGSTMILVTHDLGIAAEIADRIAIMYAGKVVEVGSVDKIFYEPLHPYTKALLRAVPRVRFFSKIEAIPGEPPDLINPPSGCSFHPRCPLSMEICKREEPPMIEIEPRRPVACWLHAKR
jgi:peptide/nickel transport system ATP-binding protein